MNRRPCGYLASQLRVNPTRLNISLVLIKTHFLIRNSENFIKRRVADRWSQFLKSKISVFLSIQLLKFSSNFNGLMSRVISTQLFRIMTIKKNMTIEISYHCQGTCWQIWELTRIHSFHFTVHVNCFEPGMVTAEKLMLFQFWHCLIHINHLERLCFKLDAMSFISATHARGKDNSFCLPSLACRVKAFVLPKIH